MSDLKYGDLVKVYRKCTSGSVGWEDDMDGTIGMVGVIEHTDSLGSFFVDGLGWWYPPESLLKFNPEDSEIANVVANIVCMDLD